MRLFAMAFLLAGAAGLPGCGEPAPANPYSDVRMLTPEELGTANRDEDPVEQAERTHNGQFAADSKKKPR